MGFSINRNLVIGSISYQQEKTGFMIKYQGIWLPAGKPPGVNLVVISSLRTRYGVLPDIQQKGESSAKIAKSTADDLLKELNVKYQKRRIAPIIFFITIIAMVLSYFLNPTSLLPVIVAGLVGLFFTFIARRRDILLKSTAIYYKLEAEAETAYQSLYQAFNELLDCNRVWNIHGQTHLEEWQQRKRQAGAGRLIDRYTLFIRIAQPPYLSTNVPVPSIPFRGHQLYFLPDQVLVYNAHEIKSVSYASLQVNSGFSNFIDEQYNVPKDATVVDHKWRYVNKNGSPDKRFKNNALLPVARYGQISFSYLPVGDSTIQTSKQQGGVNFEDSFKRFIEFRNRQS